MFDINNPFHEGQQAVQKITGEEDIAIRRLPMLKDSIAHKAVRFIEDQIQVIIGSEAPDGKIWLSLFIGDRGFISVPSSEEVVFDRTKIRSTGSDLFYDNVKSCQTVGLLFHEGINRKRYRAWGKAIAEDKEIKVEISLGYPSCPKHIQREKIELTNSPALSIATQEAGQELGESEKKWIKNAHTFFIGTQSSIGDIEASHRGGDPGFIEIIEGDILRVPDYLGNSIYSTLGNIYQNPKCAMLFVDYNTGEILQITGTAALQFDQFSYDDTYKSGETGRFFTFKTEKWIRTQGHHSADSEFIDQSRYNVPTRTE